MTPGCPHDCSEVVQRPTHPAGGLGNSDARQAVVLEQRPERDIHATFCRMDAFRGHFLREEALDRFDEKIICTHISGLQALGRRSREGSRSFHHEA